MESNTKKALTKIANQDLKTAKKDGSVFFGGMQTQTGQATLNFLQSDMYEIVTPCLVTGGLSVLAIGSAETVAAALVNLYTVAT
jgi:histidine ammonia-lyase